MPESFDLVVVGAGTGGYVAAIRAAQLGLRTAVVERQPALGGTCLNWGCIPTKTLLEHAHALKIARQADEWGITFGAGAAAPAIDLVQVHARQSKIVSGMTRGVEYLFKKNRITWDHPHEPKRNDRTRGDRTRRNGNEFAQIICVSAGRSDSMRL